MIKIVDTGVRFEYAGEQGTFNWIKLKQKGLNMTEYQRVIAWCFENFGTDGMDTWFYSYIQSKIYFRNRDDLMMFLLRWS